MAKSAEKVVLFPGVTNPKRPAHSQKQTHIVTLLERLLEQTDSGQIQALSVAYVNSDGTKDYDYECSNGLRWDELFAATVTLETIMKQDYLEDDS